MYVEDVQTVIEILTEFSQCATASSQMSIGGGDDANVDADRPRASQSQELPRSWSTRKRNFACATGVISVTLVEEQHATRGQFNLTRLRLVRAGERSTLESEQLRLEELLRQRGAIDRDERAPPSRRPLVDEPRDDFLAAARLALKARRRFGGCHLRRAPDDVTPGIRCTDGGVNLSASID